jgi:hypothetical protein
MIVRMVQVLEGRHLLYLISPHLRGLHRSSTIRQHSGHMQALDADRTQGQRIQQLDTQDKDLGFGEVTKLQADALDLSKTD